MLHPFALSSDSAHAQFCKIRRVFPNIAELYSQGYKIVLFKKNKVSHKHDILRIDGSQTTVISVYVKYKVEETIF